MKIQPTMKIQSTMKILAAFAVLYVDLAAARLLRGDSVTNLSLVNTMESVTGLVHSLNRHVHNTSTMDVQNYSTKNHTKTDQPTKIALIQANNIGTHKPTKIAEADPSSVIPVETMSPTEMQNLTLGDIYQKIVNVDLRIKGRVCDAEFCRALQQAKCDAKCALNRDRDAKRQDGMQSNSTAATDGTAGSLYADEPVWAAWSGLYGPQVAYVRDCFKYSTGKDPGVQPWHAEIKSNRGPTKSFEVISGRERMGMCYAIYYIGTIEEKSETTCHEYKHLRQSLCPECCDATADEQGCTGGCSP